MFFTSQAIEEWRKIYWPLMSRPEGIGSLPPGILLGEHFGHLLVVRSLRFDERTQTEEFRLGWQSAQLELTANKKMYERVGLWYPRRPGYRDALDSSIADLLKFKEDLELLPTRIKDGQKLDGLIATTTYLNEGKMPLAARALVFNLTSSTVREVVVQTDPLENRW